MGRPKKSEPRSRQFNLSLTDAEYESIVSRATALGMQPVNYGRSVLLRESGVPERGNCEPPSRISALILGQLHRLGNNLNQMVRRLHATGAPLPPDLEPLLIDIRKIIARGDEI